MSITEINNIGQRAQESISQKLVNSLQDSVDVPISVENPQLSNENLFQQYENTFKTPGDEILMTLQKISNNHSTNIDAVNATIDHLASKNEINISDTIALQKLLIDYQLTQDLISKGAEKISQGAQTLFKNQ